MPPLPTTPPQLITSVTPPPAYARNPVSALPKNMLSNPSTAGDNHAIEHRHHRSLLGWLCGCSSSVPQWPSFVHWDYTIRLQYWHNCNHFIQGQGGINFHSHRACHRRPSYHAVSLVEATPHAASNTPSKSTDEFERIECILQENIQTNEG